MIIGVLLNIAGFTVIFIEKGSFVSPSYTLGKLIKREKTNKQGYVHGIFGCMVMFYSGINVLLGLFRPDLESPRRKKWRRTHFIYAGLAILLSNVFLSIFFISLISFLDEYNDRAVHGILEVLCHCFWSAQRSSYAFYSPVSLLAFFWRFTNADSPPCSVGRTRHSAREYRRCSNNVPFEHLKTRSTTRFLREHNIKAFRCTSILILFAQDGVLSLSSWYLWHNQKST